MLVHKWTPISGDQLEIIQACKIWDVVDYPRHSPRGGSCDTEPASRRETMPCLGASKRVLDASAWATESSPWFLSCYTHSNPILTFIVSFLIKIRRMESIPDKHHSARRETANQYHCGLWYLSILWYCHFQSPALSHCWKHWTQLCQSKASSPTPVCDMFKKKPKQTVVKHLVSTRHQYKIDSGLINWHMYQTLNLCGGFKFRVRVSIRIAYKIFSRYFEESLLPK